MTETTFWAYYGGILRKTWGKSKWFRILLIISIVWAALRLIAQIVLAADPVSSQLSVDLQVYLDAATHFVERTNLYPASLEILEYHFPYPPPFALLFTVFLKLPKVVTIFLHMAIHILAYYLLFTRWGKILNLLRLDKASETLIRTLPLWFVFVGFWDDLIYLNIYTIMALLVTLLIEAILDENLRWSVVWLTVILLTKPHFAFAAIIPLFLIRYKFFFKMLLWAIVSYAAISLFTILVGRPDYVLGQYRDYLQLLTRLGNDFPWRVPEAGFLGYNHSIKQIFAFYGGISASTLTIATIVKLVLLIPLAVITIPRLLRPVRQLEQAEPWLLEVVLLIYLGVFIWLDIVWEAFLTIAIFGYLLSALKARWQKIALACIFVPYAILDAWRLIAYVTGSPMITDAYLQWDYSMYFPIIMIVILTFYVILAVRQWPRRARQAG
jgi:hypothetical protein